MSVQAETPASEPAETKTWWQRLAAAARWPILLWAAIGAFSAFVDLIPNLRRLSMLIQGLTAAYRITRDWIYEALQIAFGWIHIRIPDIPELWKDGLIIASLVLVALNLESLRRDKISLLWSMGLSLRAWMSGWIGRRSIERPALVRSQGWTAETITVLAMCLVGILAAFLLHLAGWPLLQRFLSWPAPLLMTIEGIIIGLGLRGLWSLSFLCVERLPLPSWLDRIFSVIVVVIFAAPALTFYLMSALWNGRLAVLAALGLVVGLVGLNMLCLYCIDPFVAAPPSWWTQLIENA